MNKYPAFFLLFFSGILFSLLFELRWYYILFISILYFLVLFYIRKYHQKQKEELELFRFINSYMSQISQSFVRSKNILSALQETATTFPSNPLQGHLLESIEILLLEGGDILSAEKKALDYLERIAPCERLHTLHEFMRLAENQGGDCQKEFILLEKMRLVWERTMLKYHQLLTETRNFTVLLYAFMLFICIFVLHAFPIELSILQLEFIQITNCILVSLLVVFYALLDKQLCCQLLRPPSKMDTKKELESAFPKWLFDLMLLMQRNSVESAILQSLSTAPEILQPELQKLSESLIAYPGEITVFTTFLADYELPQVEMNMRKLYALSIGAEEKADSINFMIEANMDSLMHSEEKRYELKGGISTLFQFLPLLVVSFGMLIYCAAIIFVSLSHINHLFE